MGTNYYWHRNVCGHCKRADKPIHIGKSSFGWCFSLHVDPEGLDGIKITNLEDWKRLWSEPNSVIRDEYGDDFSPAEMLLVITDRRPGRYCHEDQQPKRHPVDNRHCIGSGPGSWDLIVGIFC